MMSDAKILAIWILLLFVTIVLAMYPQTAALASHLIWIWERLGEGLEVWVLIGTLWMLSSLARWRLARKPNAPLPTPAGLEDGASGMAQLPQGISIFWTPFLRRWTLGNLCNSVVYFLGLYVTGQGLVSTQGPLRENARAVLLFLLRGLGVMAALLIPLELFRTRTLHRIWPPLAVPTMVDETGVDVGTAAVEVSATKEAREIKALSSHYASLVSEAIDAPPQYTRLADDVPEREPMAYFNHPNLYCETTRAAHPPVNGDGRQFLNTQWVRKTAIEDRSHEDGTPEKRKIFSPRLDYNSSECTNRPGQLKPGVVNDQAALHCQGSTAFPSKFRVTDEGHYVIEAGIYEYYRVRAASEFEISNGSVLDDD
ncbi:hypothetical protein DFH09DRAFT_1475695 [Mycena vulgaris]|nr:hypothetical protein DFH09DRAFT_1475695 [Mycena vulgaris]